MAEEMRSERLGIGRIIYLEGGRRNMERLYFSFRNGDICITFGEHSGQAHGRPQSTHRGGRAGVLQWLPAAPLQAALR